VIDVAWGRAGNHPSVSFASWNDEQARWVVMTIAPAAGTSPWAGRVVQLAHDGNGNRFVVFDDPDTRQVVLASAPHDAHAVNRPIHISHVGQQAGSPAMLWDGQAIVIAYGLLDGGGGIEIVELEPEIDDEGRIPNGGEGVPGIPEPVFSFSPPRTHALAWPGGRSTLPYVPPSPDSGIVDDPPAMTRVEELPDGRLLVTWIAADHLGYTVRSQAGWSFQGWLPLPDPVDHEAVRAEARRLLGGRGLRR
jgi:hypothetical protein